MFVSVCLRVPSKVRADGKEPHDVCVGRIKVTTSAAYHLVLNQVLTGLTIQSDSIVCRLYTVV